MAPSVNRPTSVTRTIAFDTETYYDAEYSVRLMSTFAYVRHPKFNCYFVSAYCPEYQYAGGPSQMNWSLLHGARVIAHNAVFDRSVFERMQALGHAPKDIVVGEWVDSADLTAWMRCKRDLKTAAKVLLGEDVSKDVRAKMKGKPWADVRGTELAQSLQLYALRDAKMAYELWDRYSAQWPQYEQNVSVWGQQQGIRGIRTDEALLETSIRTLSELLFVAQRKIPWDWEGAGYKTPLAIAFIREECRKSGITCPVAFGKDDEECAEWEDTYAEQYPWVRAIRDWRRVNMLYQKLLAMRDNTCDGRMQYALKYFGAATGRWSGDQRFNVQNLPREAMFGVDVRAHILPEEGHKLVIPDYSQIEAWMLLWMVRDVDAIALAETVGNLYKAYAVKTGRATREQADAWSKADKDYMLAKASVLGLGYGCGHKKFATLAKSMTGGRLVLSPEEARASVDEFRATYPKIVRFWALRDQAVKTAATEQQDKLVVRLPSGRDLVYFTPKWHREHDVENNRFSSRVYGYATAGGKPSGLYGGKLTENIIQALARDVLVDGWNRAVAAGFPQPLFTCHDEFVFSVPAADAETVAHDLKALLSIPPPWAEDLPLSCSVAIADHYEK